ncbi:uncharacterized protein APUU_20752S [Aspergillus puulaauensis]|uniref:Uncharacterized protein n=1 Tax=Aspergillus puulaauensis TaxID=1220207 RepID=A0A7R8AK46_9EURO|nr:uncharacterized protein APUU_20752S [Aspergillus puulaauensis]BCS20320.1 hypothetical protein APUU_20752S [Aspergillus puulaauensis]
MVSSRALTILVQSQPAPARFHYPREPGYLRESTVTRFDNKIAPQEIKLEDSVLSFQTDFKGEEYRYVLNAQRGLYDNQVLSFYTGRRGHFEGKIGYKCINGVAKAILLPPGHSVFIVQEPQFDGDYAKLSYGAPTGGVLSYGGGRNHHIHDIYVNFQR